MVIDKFPEFMYVNLARYGLAQGFYRKGDLEKTREILETIPLAERNGDLAVVPYLLADCLMRLAPVKADDALAAGRMEEQLKAAAELLSSFVGAQPNDPQAADALLKLGLCHQRLAGLLGRQHRLGGLGLERPGHPLRPVVANRQVFRDRELFRHRHHHQNCLEQVPRQ